MSLLEKYPYMSEILDSLSELVDNSNYYVVAGKNGSVPAKKLNNAKSSYAPFAGIGEDGEEILFLYDDTAFGSAKEGYLFTNHQIYLKNLFENPTFLDYSQLNNLVYDKGELYIYDSGDSWNHVRFMHLHGYENLRDKLIEFISALIVLDLEKRSDPPISDSELREMTNVVKETRAVIKGGVSGLDAFFDKYIMPYEDQIEDLIRKLGSDGNIETIVDKVIDFIPAPARYVVPRSFIKKIVVSMKNKMFN